MTEVTLIKNRRITEIPVDQIKVINSRIRAEDQFQMNVDSIHSIGLQMPIRVNDKFYDSSGSYELICGEGRLIAHKRLRKETIEAEIVTCSRKQAYLESLIENIARGIPNTMDFGYELKRLYDQGWDYNQIAKIACKRPEYIRQYIRLVEKGENRLIQGVEKGVFPITFAVQVAQSDNGNVQNLLMDAFDEGVINSSNFASARKIITNRLKRSHKENTGLADPTGNYTVEMLTRDIAHATEAKNSYVRQAKDKEGRLFLLLDGISVLWQDSEFIEMARDEKVIDRPTLSGDYGYARDK
jgi:ParB family chromosome partitioning protein